MSELEERRLEIDSGGVTLQGELNSSGEEDTLVVLCHGIPLSAPDPSDGGYALLSRNISSKGFATVFFNLRGTGDSGGNFHVGGWYSDLESVMRFTREELAGSFKRVFLAGFSAGGALSLKYAAEHGGVSGVAAFAAPATFTGLFPRERLVEFLEIAREVGIIRESDFPADPESFYLELESNAALDYVAGVSPVPLLLVHGEDDEMVPVNDAKALFGAAGEPGELVLLPGGMHRLRKDPRTVDCLLDWIGQLT